MKPGGVPKSARLTRAQLRALREMKDGSRMSTTAHGRSGCASGMTMKGLVAHGWAERDRSNDFNAP